MFAGGKVAENTERYCSKGSMVSVDGRIQTRNYDNKQGQKVYVTEVIADSVQFINTRKENQTAPQAQTNSYVHNEPIQQFEDDEELIMDDEDIQF